MPRVGSSKRKTRASPSSHFASTTFCCVPPERLRASCSVPGVRICSSSIMRMRRGAFARDVDEQIAIDEFGEVRERDVLANGHAEHEALRFAIFGE